MDSIKEELEKLKAIMTQCWNKETCYPPLIEQWTKDKPSIGQCAVTALVIQDFLKGHFPTKIIGNEIVFNREYNHYWNKIVYSTREEEYIDFTKDQFDNSISSTEFSVDEIIETSLLINPSANQRAKTSTRYNELKKLVETCLSKTNVMV